MTLSRRPPRGLCTLVASHPIPAHQQESGIGHQVEQVVELAISIITSPTVQLGLDLQYPNLGAAKRRVRLVGVHQRPPDLLAFQRSHCMTCWSPSPCVRLSRTPRRVVTPATTTRPPSHPNGPQPGRACLPSTRVGEGRRPLDGSHVHRAIDQPGRCPALLRQHRHGYAADLHHGLPTVGTRRLRS